MSFAVAGVSGRTGAIVATTLLDAGLSVRVIVRDAAKGAPWAARGAQVAVADLSDAAALTEALRGVDGAYLLVPPNPAAPDFRAHQAAVSASIVTAVRASAVPHVVLLSSIAAHLPAGTGPIAALHALEQTLSALPGTALSFLRAGYFLENLQGNFGALGDGVFPTFIGADVPVDTIATEDIGATAAALLREGPPPVGQPRIVELGGPAITMTQVAAELSIVLGRPIALHVGPVEAMAPTLQGFGFSADLAGLYAEMTTAMNAGTLAFEGVGRRVYGTTSLGAFLRGALGR